MGSDRTDLRKANAKALAEGYTWQKRAIEIISLALCYTLWLHNFIRVSRYFVHEKDVPIMERVLTVPAVLAGVLFADLMSGIAHWALDTWGSCETPVFGAFIRSFREHHVDQTSITRHDWIETNGDNSMPILPALVAMYLFPSQLGGTWWFSPVYQSFLVSATIFIALTNQAHKMSHSAKQPALIRWLMRRGVIMSVQHHRVHHSGDFSAYYCITTGWLNAPLDAVGFWRKLEKFITATTGAIPRADDKKLLVVE